MEHRLRGGGAHTRLPRWRGHIRKYDGEPFEPKHIVAGVKEILAGNDVVNVLSTEAGWRTDHPTGTSGDWAGRLVGSAFGRSA